MTPLGVRSARADPPRTPHPSQRSHCPLVPQGWHRTTGGHPRVTETIKPPSPNPVTSPSSIPVEAHTAAAPTTS